MKDLLKQGYISNPMQVYTLRRVTLAEGKAKGTDIIEVCTAGGLQLDITVDTGLDIGQARYKGTPIAFVTKNGYDSPYTDLPYEMEFLRNFPGGMFYTCGLRSTGEPNLDGDEWHPLHGRYHSLAADNICSSVEDNIITVRGTVRETVLSGHVLELKRTIRIPIFDARVTVEDEITNLNHNAEEFALLYHCNFGYPLVSEKARVELPEKRKTTPRTEFAKTGLGKETTFDAPILNEDERVFFHEEMERSAAIVNEDIGIKMSMNWSDTLPVLAHWRNMASGDYVCGLEPTNCYIRGRKEERAHGTLPILQPFETVKTHVTINFESI